MAIHVVVGAGPVGTAIAADLLERGETVRVITRSGSGLAGTERIAADASDTARMVELTAGAAVIYNAVNPPYDKWVEMWPPIAAALLEAAAASGAVLAIVDNLYAFGPVDGPMSARLADSPSSVKGAVRQQMWDEARAAAAAGRITATVAVRGSDYVGDGPSLISMMVLPRARKGKVAMIPADLDAAHTWTNPADAGRLLVKAALDPRGWNRYWLVPSAPALSIRELSTRATELAGLPAPKIRKMPRWMLRTAGLFNAMARELVEMNYQFQRTFVLDTTDTAAVFGGDFTPLDQSLRQNLELAAVHTPAPTRAAHYSK
jgi:nucleoside-diphosphate-sugar epimerase